MTIAILAASVFGAIATALDFGGWRAADWRAALFVLFGAATVLGTYRMLRLVRT